MKISVVIAAYNAAATIERAVRSVLNQTRAAEEVIVVDDGSTDDTATIVEQFGTAVRLIRQTNGGASAARNAGIQNAGCDWIAFLDADDEWLPEKLDLQEKFFSAHPDIAWEYGNFIPTDFHGIPQKTTAHPAGNDTIFEDYLGAYSRGLYAWTSTLVICKNVFATVGGFEPGMKRAQDNDLWFRIAYQHPRVGYIGRPLAIYHRDTPGSSTKVNVQYEFIIRLVERHLALSAQHNRREAFLPCVERMLEVWIRELIHDGHGKAVRDIMTHFESYLSPRFVREMRFRLAIPAANAAVDLFLKWKDRLRR